MSSSYSTGIATTPFAQCRIASSTTRWFPCPPDTKATTRTPYQGIVSPHLGDEVQHLHAPHAHREQHDGDFAVRAKEDRQCFIDRVRAGKGCLQVDALQGPLQDKLSF